MNIVLNVKTENEKLVQDSLWNEGNGFCQSQQSAWIVNGNATVDVQTYMGIRRTKKIKNFTPEVSKPWTQNFQTQVFKPSGTDPSGSGSGHKLDPQSQSYLDKICQSGCSNSHTKPAQNRKFSNHSGYIAKRKLNVEAKPFHQVQNKNFQNKFLPNVLPKFVHKPPQNPQVYQKGRWNDRNRQT